MVVKNVKYKGSQMVNTNYPVENFNCDDNYGLEYTPQDTSIPYPGEATNIHNAIEASEPIWNRVRYALYQNVGSSHSTVNELYGVDDLGQTSLLMEDVIGDLNRTDMIIRTFDLSGSACTGGLSKNPSTGTSGYFKVNIPKRLKHYEDIDIIPNWYNPSWTRRKRTLVTLPLQHVMTSKGVTFYCYVAYDSDMKSDFSDIIFCGPDGVTPLPQCRWRYTTSSSAVFQVYIPWYLFRSKTEDTFNFSNPTSPYDAYNNPQYIYMYYGNANATLNSDMGLDGNAIMYDDFNDSSINTSLWTTYSPSGTSISESGDNITLTINAGYSGGDACAIFYTLESGFNSLGREIHFKVKRSGGDTNVIAPLIRLTKDSSNYVSIQLTYSSGTWYWQVSRNEGGTFTTSNAHQYSAPMDIDWYVRIRVFHGTQMQFQISLDGYRWDTVFRYTIPSSHTNYTTLTVYNYAPTTPSSSVTVYIDKINITPLGTNTAYDFIDNYSNSNINTTQWNTLPRKGAISEGSNYMRFSSSAGVNCDWNSSTSTYNAPFAWITGLPGDYENGVIIETKLIQQGSSYYQRAGIVLAYNDTNQNVFFGRVIDSTYTSGTLLRQTHVGSSIYTRFGPNGLVSVPLWLRIVKEPTQKKIWFDYSTDGYQWKRWYAEIWDNLYTWSAGGLTSCSWSGSPPAMDSRFEYFKMFRTSDLNGAVWTAEESYTDYPLETTTTDAESTQLTFTKPSSWIRNTPVQIRTKEYGGDYQKSRSIGLSNGEILDLGPNGIDKYKKLMVKFNTKGVAGDSVRYPWIEYNYEV